MKKTIFYSDNVNFFYTHLKKHYCPECGKRVQTRYMDESINSDSPEAKEYDFPDIGDGIKLRTIYFYCTDCRKEISFNDMKDFEET